MQINYFDQVLEVGTLVTMTCGSDRYGGKIKKIYTPKKIEIDFIADDGIVWETSIWTLRKNNRWTQEHHQFEYWHNIYFGEAENYRDPDF